METKIMFKLRITSLSFAISLDPRRYSPSHLDPNFYIIIIIIIKIIIIITVIIIIIKSLFIEGNMYRHTKRSPYAPSFLEVVTAPSA